MFDFNRLIRALGPIAAATLSVAVAGCDHADIQINGEKGKPLSELDLSGAPPHELVMLGPDEVQITPGDKLAITVEGDPEAKDALRFTLKDGELGILRKDKLFQSGGKTALVRVTMPAPSELTMAGSGKLSSAALDRKAKITIAGSGDISTPDLAGDSLDLTIAGSGTYHAAGSVRDLDLTVAGSGTVDADALKAEKAKVSIAGSGNAAFASDGEVDASIMGSGKVTVKGRAKCTVSALGSGKLVCETPATVRKDN